MEGTGSMLVSAGAVCHYVRYNPGMCLEGQIEIVAGLWHLTNCHWTAQ